jgi:1-acyl-sn-glycerol-3-phosphate acyltransferase
VVPLRTRYVLARFWVHVIMGGLKVLCGLDYRIEGRENLPAGGHVALWKHSSSWETFAMVLVCPPQVWVLKRELLWIPFVGWGIRQMHSIAIDRGSGHSAVKQVVDQGRRYIEQGIWVMVFPEGTRMAAGETRKYGVSGALLAREAGCLVVPIAHDAGYYWPKRGLLKKRGTVTVVIGKPIDPAGRDPREVNEEAQAWVEGTIREIRARRDRLAG